MFEITVCTYMVIMTRTVHAHVQQRRIFLLCMYAYMHACVCVYVYISSVFFYVTANNNCAILDDWCACTYTCMCIDMRAQVCTDAHTGAQMYMHRCAYTHGHVHIHMCVQARTHTHKNTHTHTHIHVRTYTQA